MLGKAACSKDGEVTRDKDGEAMLGEVACDKDGEAIIIKIHAKIKHGLPRDGTIQIGCNLKIVMVI